MPEPAPEAIASLAAGLAAGWIRGDAAPKDSVEAIAPEFHSLLGQGEGLSFDHFRHEPQAASGWVVTPLPMPALFAAPMDMVIPATWQLLPTSEPLVIEGRDASGARVLVLQVVNEHKYPDAVATPLQAGRLLAFEVSPGPGICLTWRFVAKTLDGFEVWSIFTAGEYGLVVLASAADIPALRPLIESSVNSAPWSRVVAASR